jgi:hypothetical protein
MLGPRTCAHGSGGQCCLRLLPGKTRDGVWLGSVWGEVLPKPTHRAGPPAMPQAAMCRSRPASPA